MGIWDALRRLTGLAPAAGTESARVVEAAGTTIDDDEDQWRPLSGDSRRDLQPMTQSRMQQLAVYLWERNGLANRLIELPVAYITGKGCSVTVDDPAALLVLKRHWADGLNCWDIKLPKRCRELALFGEQCWIAFRNPATGFVRWGYLDPSRIDGPVTDPDNVEQVIGVRTVPDERGNRRTFRTIVNVRETAFGRQARAMRAQMVDGECLYFRVNDLSAGKRGRSDLLPLCDWLDAYEEFLYGELDRTDHLRNYVWDVTLKGADETQVAKRAKEISAPAPNSVRVHNDSEVWKAESPQLNAYEAAAGGRMFRNHILGSRTLPPTWFADGEDANKSNSQGMAEPTERVLEARQTFVGHCIVEAMRYVLRSAWFALDRDVTEEEQRILDSVSVNWPALTAKDTSKYAAALQQVISAAAQALDAQLLSRETAVALIASLAEQLGVEIDAEAELEAALEDGATRGLDERGPVPPVLDPDPSGTADTADPEPQA